MTKTLSGLILALVALLGVPFAFADTPAKTKDAAPAAAAKPSTTDRLPLTGTSTLAAIDKSGVLHVGIAINAPWVMHDKQGKPIGYSVDLAQRLAAAMGWKLQLIETSWPELMSGLRSNEYDVVISGLSITPQRARYVQFTDPVGEFDVDATVNRDKFKSGGLADLRKLPHAKVGAHKGELTVDFARSALPDADVVEIDDESAAIADLGSGKLDAYVAEAPLPQVLEKTQPDKLRVLGNEPLARTAHGLAVRVGDTGLLRVLNAWITYERASGWLKSRSDYWFDGMNWASEL
jgi:polar amino acid transport system substrate-binding protein